MNYRHAFHAGNHADVLKHVVLLALCDALTAKPAACFALDTHAGQGVYRLHGDAARRTGEAEGGILRLRNARDSDPLLQRYLRAVNVCRGTHSDDAYPGSPWLLAHALRAQDRIACCELQPEEAAALKAAVGGDPRIAVHARDGYAAVRALLPPRDGATRIHRGLVLIDPPYEQQLEEFTPALAAIREGLQRWPQATYALWYPIKQRRSLQRTLRAAAALEAPGGVLVCELLVRPDDSPLRMNGSGMLLVNPPWRLDTTLEPTLDALVPLLAEPGPSPPPARLEWLRPAR
ncbi:23S rRNA (adenine(2030)-N(6))-methyltransferase RlmJ [Luteimonas abyssi]|uniref:23S rRNA (adenine(2030)-N(6))-methyltransferase RlmJ n=1 Tax=Luteimonas abyssi TaxID=1247514 RepID=UPI000737B652|nr:23S rRNA (adenine(2030)-N(6))-methyltransferase RlmJ [Luteimonas abyssi]